MLGRNLSNCFVVGLGAGALMLGEAVGESGGNNHPGQTLEQASGQPVVASVKAWPRSDQTGSDGDCPMYGDAPLDSRTSENDGAFELSIESGQPTYTVVYCANGYYTRIDRDLPNASDGEPIIPRPVYLKSVASMQTGEALAQFDVQVVRLSLYALNELAYLRSVNPERFDSAISQYAEVLGEPDSKGAVIFRSLSGSAAEWQK